MKKETVKTTPKNKKLETQLKELVERDKLKDTNTEGVLSDKNKEDLKGIYEGKLKEKLTPAYVHEPKYIDPRTSEPTEQTLDEKIRDNKQLVLMGIVAFLLIILVLYAYNSFK